MTDTATQLTTLRALRDATTDPVQRAALDAAIAMLEGLTRPPTQAALASTSVAQASDHSQARQMTAMDQSRQDLVNQGDIGRDLQTGGTRYETLIQVVLHAAGVTTPTDDQRDQLTSYLEHLAQRCDRLRLHGVVDWERKRGKAPAFTLSQVYVTLAATAWVPLAEADAPDAFADAIAQGDPATVLPQDTRRVIPLHLERGLTSAHTPRYQLQAPLLLTAAVSQRPQLVLLGAPGSGKSSFLRHLAVALARAGSISPAVQSPALPGWTAGLLLPLYASLGGFAAWTHQHGHPLDADSFWRYLVQQSDSGLGDDLRPLLRQAFRQGRLLLLLDGLDEVADPGLRSSVASAVATLAGAQRGRVVLTCRSRSLTPEVAAPLHAWGDPLEVAPFTLGQMGHFVRGWYQRSTDQSVFTAEEAARRADALVARLAALPALRDLGQTPLLLTIITILHYYEGKLPDDRADLYEDMVQLLLTRWTQQRREAGAPPGLLEQLAVGGLRDYHLRHVLEKLAYRAHQRPPSPDGRGILEQGIVREAFLSLFREFDLRPGPANEKTEHVLAYLEEESGLLLHDGGETYVFPHLTYEEYLAGCFLVQPTPDADFAQRAYPHWQTDAPRWREVIFLSLGWMVRNRAQNTAATWLRVLLEPCHGARARAVQEYQQAALFAAECLAEMGGKAALIGVTTLDLAQLWQQLAQALAEIVASTILPASERVRAGVFLGDLGDPRPGVCTLPPSMVPFAGGTFLIGSSPEEAAAAGRAYEQYWLEQGDKETAQRARTWPEDEINDQPITLAPFTLARYPITNAQYQLFLDDGGYDLAAPWWDAPARAWLQRDDAATEGLDDWQRRQHKQHPEYWHDARFGIAHPNHPVVGVAWYEAVAFCRWLTQHPTYNPERHSYCLPSEAEWEYAARGASRRPYPWGDTAPNRERANYDRIYTGTTAVGCFPLGATPEGITDLAGNVWEWTRSVYAPYPYTPDNGRETPQDPNKKHFVVRGGGWVDVSINLRASSRYDTSPDDVFNVLGFRLAQHLPVGAVS